MIGKYNRSVILTYIGVCLSVTGMALTMRDILPAAVICLIFAGICDLFDGVVARKCKRTEEEKQFGVQIDSLADMISFVAFPVVLGLHTTKQAEAATVIIMAMYTLCGIIRLAWFNMNANAEGGGRYYSGLPVTYSALIIPIVWLTEGVIGKTAFTVLHLAVYAIIAMMFILNVKIPKPTGKWYVIFGITAIALTAAVIVKALS